MIDPGGRAGNGPAFGIRLATPPGAYEISIKECPDRSYPLLREINGRPVQFELETARP